MNALLEYPGVQEMFRIFNEAGYELYIVGGAVRDSLLERPIQDIDFTTNATPKEIKSLFNDTIDVGADFGTIAVRLGEDIFEVTTFRQEGGYRDKRHPSELSFSKTLDEDLSRRDLTINGLAVNEVGEIIDRFNGLDDLKNGIVRTIGQPSDRFEEDQLRKWRAVRFAAQLGFEIEPETYHSLLYDPLTDKVSVERIQEELNRILLSDKANWGGYLLNRTRLYPLLLQRLGIDTRRFESNQDFIEPFEILQRLPKDLISRLATMLLPFTLEEAALLLNGLKYSKEITRLVLILLEAKDITKGATCKRL